MAKITTPRVTRDGALVVVAMPGQDSPATRKDARTLCQREVGTITVGALQAFHEIPGGHAYTWKPDLTRNARPVAEVNVANVMAALDDEAEAQEDNDERLAAYTVEDRLDRVEEALAHLSAAVSALAGGQAAKAAKAPKAPKAASTFVEDVIAPKAAKRAAVTCKTCNDFGVVRGSGPRVGEPFRTANGAAMAPTAVPCTSHKRARKAA